ncbi:CHAT domain-containing protein [Kribbella sp. NPDC050820]|uniref:CHAT domain-containing protein n=1 Tax=Kribbella sp. NPDC050820 TaxID=3155408 RepID=UPI0033F922E8
MTTYEFKIVIDREGVSGEYGLPGSQASAAGRHDLMADPIDPLTLATVALMNRWLCFWDLIEEAEVRRREDLLDSSALKVLGTQLWRLILADKHGQDNPVGQELKKRIPKEGQPPLRLSIVFADDADADLKALPWEFLYEPEGNWFLATKTELLLTRYVTMAEKPVTVKQVSNKDKLSAMLIAALPEAPDFAIHREALGKLRTALKDVPDLWVAKAIKSWDAAKVQAELSKKPYHILHIVGICRGTPDHPQIYLGGAGDGYQDPAQFVEILTANTIRPRLVILQLCDYKDGDATENFERLAPDLIRRQVPAVLALQYAVKIDQADRVGLGKQFYERLVSGEHIGAAVQASRRGLQVEHEDRRFGTPVLYLQEDGALRRELPIAIKTTTPTTNAPESSKRTDLIDVVIATKGLTPQQENAMLAWIAGLDPDLDDSEIATLIKKKMLTRIDARTRAVYARMLRALDLGRPTEHD